MLMPYYLHFNAKCTTRWPPCPSLFSNLPKFRLQSKVGASAKRLNLKSSPAPFKNLFTPISSAFSDNTSSAPSNVPRFNGPLRLPSSSHRWFCAVFTKATKCRSTSAEASGAAVAPCTAAAACASAMAGDDSINRARSEGGRGMAEVMRRDKGVSGAVETWMH